MTDGSSSQAGSISISQLLLAIVGAVATAGGIWTWGFMVGDNSGDTALQLMKDQNEIVKEENAKLQSELTTVKVDLEKIKASESSAPPASTENNADIPSPARKVEVKENDSVEIFNGELLVTLVGTEYEGDPLHYTVTATFNLNGAEPLQMKAADPGFRARYRNFEITILSADSGSATFSIYKSGVEPNPADQVGN